MIEFRGPSGHVIYRGHGLFHVKVDKSQPAVNKNFSRISMIAGGSGITPMLQVIMAILDNPKDNTQIRMLFANSTEDDILCRDHLEKLAEEHPNRFVLRLVVSQHPGPSHKFETGRINVEMFKKWLHPASPETCVLLCGPTPMVNQTCLPSLKDLGHDGSSLFVF